MKTHPHRPRTNSTVSVVACVTGIAVAISLQAPGLQPAEPLVGPRNDATVRALQQPVRGGEGGRRETERPVEETSQLQPRH